MQGVFSNSANQFLNSPSNYILDNVENYSESTVSLQSENQISLRDHPHIRCNGPTVLHAGFKDYIRFRPSASDSMYVTLGLVSWNIHCQTDLTTVGTNVDYSPVRGSGVEVDAQQTGSSQMDAAITPSVAFPVWGQTFFNPQ
jgi:hypothetical protein